MKGNKIDNTLKQDLARIYKDTHSDSYISSKKLRDSTLCPNCGASYMNGRWTWKPLKKIDDEQLCPACLRIQDGYPAGIIYLEGDFFQDHNQEIMNLIKNIEKQEMQEHPLERIMQITKENGKTVVTTTGIHLPVMIGKAIKNANKGNLEISNESETVMRVYWTR